VERMKKRRNIFLASSLFVLVGCGAPSLVPPSLDTAPQASLRPRSLKELSLLVMPDMGMKPLLSAIQGAEKSIHIEIYMFTDHDQTAQLAQALIDRAKAGVDVRVMFDPHPYTGKPQPGQPTNVNDPVMKALSAGGVKVKTANPKFTYTHEKAMVIDGTTAFIMTMNLTNSAFNKNREYAVVDGNPTDVAEVDRIFQADWNQQSVTVQDPNLVVSPDNSRRQILNLIDSAKKTIVLQCEYLTDPQVAAHLGARAKAGVEVEVMLSNQPSNAQESKLLGDQGVSKVEFIKKVTMHAKMIVVDAQEAYVGSENFTANSLDNNREMGILVQDKAAINTLITTANKDWANR
jgi:phosphatidylserine/phosphatidylglycerophosphate/cardiolipin synthase-like enzyme